MGTCDSSQENPMKYSYSYNSLNSLSGNLSSTSLPSISSKNIFSQNNDLSSIKKNKSSYSANSYLNKDYILSDKITLRQEVTENYKLTKKKLGDGATSIVYVAENSEKKKFAIKRILKDNITQSHKKSVIKEAEICKKFNHEKIIKYHEIYEDSHYISIIMELGNTDLFELIIHSPSYIIPEDIAIEFLIQIFESIDYLHSLNIIHCDIKPENYVVIFHKKGEEIPLLKLVDFGNYRKKPLNGEKIFNFSGTKEYMAPEAVDNSGFDEKVDEWGAGVIMYTMLTGVDPFTADTDSEYKDNIRFKRIKFEYIKNEKLRELNKKLLNRLVSKRITAKEALEEIKIIKKEKRKEKVNNIINEEENWNIIKNKMPLINLY